MVGYNETNSKDKPRMCGIVGVATSRGKTLSIDEKTAAYMRDVLAYRGPDDSGLYFKDNISLGHRRLAILDPEHGKQPMILPGEDGSSRFVICYNGEIYNHQELRHEITADYARFTTTCDTETLIKLLAEKGMAVLPELRGMFAFGFVDILEQKLFLVRDPLGIKPLYYAFISTGGGKEVIFASEPVGILAHPHIKAEPDWVAVSSYLSTIRLTLGERSMFRGIQVLQPSEVLTVNLADPDLSVSSFFYADSSACDSLIHEGDSRDYETETRSVISESLRVHLLSDVPTCALLSGGIDSTITATLAADCVDGLRTYCAGAKGSNESDDFFYARLAAEKIGSLHTEVVVGRDDFSQLWLWMINKLGVPLSTPNEVAIYAVARKLSQNAKVTISGEGADELFAGYEPPLRAALAYINAVESGEAKVEPTEFYLDSFTWIPGKIKPQVLREEIWAKAFCDDYLYREVSSVFQRAGDGRKNLQVHLDVQKHFNLTGLLRRLDTATMLASVEGRTPFADRVVAEFAASLPLEYKCTGGEFDDSEMQTKLILRKAFSELVPEAICRRPKASFPLPFPEWMPDQAAILIDSSSAKEVFTEHARSLVAADPTTNWLLAWPMLNIVLWLNRWWG